MRTTSCRRKTEEQRLQFTDLILDRGVTTFGISTSGFTNKGALIFPPGSLQQMAIDVSFSGPYAQRYRIIANGNIVPALMDVIILKQVPTDSSIMNWLSKTEVSRLRDTSLTNQ